MESKYKEHILILFLNEPYDQHKKQLETFSAKFGAREMNKLIYKF